MVAIILEKEDSKLSSLFFASFIQVNSYIGEREIISIVLLKGIPFVILFE